MGKEMETNGHVTTTPVHAVSPVQGLKDLSRKSGVARDGLGAGWALWRRRRFVLAALAFLGLVSLYSTRITFSVVIVAMTGGTGAHTRFSAAPANQRSADASAEAAFAANASFVNASGDASQITLEEMTDDSARGEFAWDSHTRGLLLSGFFYGYAASQLPAGWLVARAGGARLVGAGIAGAALLSLLAPTAARWGGAGLLLAVRVAQETGTPAGVWQVVLVLWGPSWRCSILLLLNVAHMCYDRTIMQEEMHSSLPHQKARILLAYTTSFLSLQFCSRVCWIPADPRRPESIIFMNNV